MSIVSRAAWGARRAKTRASRLDAPRGVTFHWGGPKVGIRSHSDCARKVKSWQDFHMDGRGWADIAYNLIVCPHGTIYEGRGVHARSAANGTDAGNGAHYAICYLGGEGEPLTAEGKRGLRDARNYLIREGNAGSQVRTHDQWKSTGCPGPDIREWARGGLVLPQNPPPSSKPVPVPAPMVPPLEDDMKFYIVSDPTNGGDYGTNGMTKFKFESQQAKNDWASAFKATRITLTAAAFEAIRTSPTC